MMALARQRAMQGLGVLIVALWIVTFALVLL